MEKLLLNIYSIEKVLFSGYVSSVTFPNELGRFTILPKHAPIISTLVAGIISFEPIQKGVNQSVVNEIKIESGFIEMNEDVVTVCVVL